MIIRSVYDFTFICSFVMRKRNVDFDKHITIRVTLFYNKSYTLRWRSYCIFLSFVLLYRKFKFFFYLLSMERRNKLWKILKMRNRKRGVFRASQTLHPRSLIGFWRSLQNSLGIGIYLHVLRTTRNFQMLFPAGSYLLKVSNRNTRTRCEICSKLTMKVPEQCYWYRSGVFIVNFEHISHLFLVILSGTCKFVNILLL